MTGAGQGGRPNRCPICGEVSKQRASTRRQVSFGGLIRRFPRCTACGSRSLDPMPSELELGHLYGVDYNAGDGESSSVEGDPRAYKAIREPITGFSRPYGQTGLSGSWTMAVGAEHCWQGLWQQGWRRSALILIPMASKLHRGPPDAEFIPLLISACMSRRLTSFIWEMYSSMCRTRRRS